MAYLPYAVGVGFVIVFFGVYKLTTKDGFSKLYEGADGRLSTSKFQFFVWTVVVIFSYAAIYTLKLMPPAPHFDPISSLPDNVLIALGMSVASASAAKAITVSYVNTNRISKPASKKESRFGQIFEDDSGVPDLSKLQMIAWTFIALATYFIAVCHNVASHKPELPDIDKSLMALMGLGHTAYLAKKAVSSDTTDTVANQSSPPASEPTKAAGTAAGQLNG